MISLMVALYRQQPTACPSLWFNNLGATHSLFQSFHLPTVLVQERWFVYRRRGEMILRPLIKLGSVGVYDKKMSMPVGSLILCCSLVDKTAHFHGCWVDFSYRHIRIWMSFSPFTPDKRETTSCTCFKPSQASGNCWCFLVAYIHGCLHCDGWHVFFPLVPTLLVVCSTKR